MAVVNAQTADDDFRADDPNTVSFQGGLVFETTRYVWSTQGGHRIEAMGSGFTYSGGVATGGTVTQLRIDLGTDGDFATDSDIDVVITGLAAALENLVSTVSVEASATGFWQEILPSNDTVRATESADGRLFGDYLAVQGEVFDPVSLTGGHDLITSNGKVEKPLALLADPNALIGDAMTVDGQASGMIAYTGELLGGNDTITANGLNLYNLVGDAYGVGELGSVAGGNDRLTNNQTGTPFQPLRSPTVLAGDVYENRGYVSGGSDTLTGTNFPFLDEVLAGDVLINEAGTATGGGDLLSGRAGQDVIAGDVFRLTGGTVNGGDDKIQGGGDSDLIAGDVYTMSGASLVAGNDRLFGGDGNDSIVGDVATFSGSLSIQAGDDYLGGGNGDDTLDGDLGSGFALLPANIGGNDTLDGGLGNDSLNGGAGIDTAVFAAILQAVAVDLGAGTATGQGSDTIAGVENVIGSAGNDRIFGNGVGNRLDGWAGDDTLRGGDGNDTLLGSSGDDLLLGEGGHDLLLGAAGSDTANGGDGDDVVKGGGDGDSLSGGFGNDTIRGEAGADSLSGGGGDDFIVGDQQGDLLTGGAGADRFDFNSVSESTPGAGRDTISDFSSAQTDRIDLSTIDADALTGSNQAFGFIGATGFSGSAGELRFTTSGGNGLLAGDTNGDAVADLAIFLTGLTSLNASDIIL